MGLEVLLFTVVLSWGQPETLPGWHMLVGEERTEVLTKTGRQMTATPASSSPSQGISVNRVADLFHHSIEDVWLVSIDVVGCALDLLWTEDSGGSAPQAQHWEVSSPPAVSPFLLPQVLLAYSPQLFSGARLYPFSGYCTFLWEPVNVKSPFCFGEPSTVYFPLDLLVLCRKQDHVRLSGNGSCRRQSV